MIHLRNDPESEADNSPSEMRSGPVPLNAVAEQQDFVCRFSGTRYDTGRFHGRHCRAGIHKELANALRVTAEHFSTDEQGAMRSVSRYRPWVKQHLPRLLPEIRGIADGSGISEEAAFFLALWNGLKPSPKSDCTSLYCGKAVTADKSVYIGQTKDTPPQDGRYRVMHFNYSDGLELILLNYPGWIANVGITSNGIGFTGNALYSRQPPAEFVPCSLLLRAILESSSSAEILQYVEAEPWQDGCLQIGTRSDNAYCVEFLSGRAFIRGITDTSNGHANSILTPEMQHLDCSDKGLPCSQKRQETITQLLEKSPQKPGPDLIRMMLSDHRNSPESICHHAQSAQATRTTAAFYANLSLGWMDVAIGYPCVTPFVRHQLASALTS